LGRSDRSRTPRYLAQHFPDLVYRYLSGDQEQHGKDEHQHGILYEKQWTIDGDRAGQPARLKTHLALNGISCQDVGAQVRTRRQDSVDNLSAPTPVTLRMKPPDVEERATQ
jgi:hypothetical protein